ncbi:MAG: tRNA (adenosine(37)-N6)-dimethylallyltransferase MiaA [Lachnospirales bacterium]
MKDKLIVIGGATASGKTGISIELAKKINGEIVSADSMQVYKYMDIGTAMVTKKEMEGIEHYLINMVEPHEEFSVAQYKDLAFEAINKIKEKKKIPILVGGTGFYINSVLYNTNFKEEKNDFSYRKELEGLVKEKGNIFLHNMLKNIDNTSYENIHYNNVKRVIRALEYYHLTGEPISIHNAREKMKDSYFNYKFYSIEMDRELLYNRINMRVDMMMEDGLLKEVKYLYKNFPKNIISMEGIGYKELAKYIEGEITLDEAINLIKQESRRLAKRQVTWFKHQTDAKWIKNIEEINMDLKDWI